MRRPRERMRTRRAPRGLGARLLLREEWHGACVLSVLGMLSVSWASGNTHLRTEPYTKGARSACLSSPAHFFSAEMGLGKPPAAHTAQRKRASFCEPPV